MTKHSYDKEFKEQAVQYYLDNKDHMTMNEISKNLGIGASLVIKQWFDYPDRYAKGLANKRKNTAKRNNCKVTLY